MAKPRKRAASGDEKQRAMKKIIDAFDAAVHPDNLSRRAYIELTNELIADLQIRLEAAMEEANREGDRP